ncbi:hypothetical protein ACFRCQ_01605 [Cytobacillus firmus]|uniref:hypothetical protein n=1 Tax=Cytobacillus firmus TaxID=1399 RepID=UPI0036C44AF1
MNITNRDGKPANRVDHFANRPGESANSMAILANRDGNSANRAIPQSQCCRFS